MNVMMNKFKSCNAEKKDIFYDEENRRHLNSIRLAYAQAAGSIADAGNKEDARKLLNKCDKLFDETNLPYGMVSRYQQHNQISMQFLYSAYKADDKALIEKVSKALHKDMLQQSKYYESLSGSNAEFMQPEADRNQELLKSMDMMEMQMKKNMERAQSPNTQNPTAVTDTAKP